jgi:hypothetical protein
MEPFDSEPLADRELDAILREWDAPGAPARLRAAVFGAPRPRWRRFWSLSIRVPLPVACALVLALAVATFAVWRKPQPVPVPLKPAPPQVIVETKTVEVPVVKKRVVYRDRRQPSTAWKPVAELLPRIIRSGQHEN